VTGPPAGGFDPATLDPRQARAFARALTYATAALAYAGERYPDFRAWCLTQPCSPDPDRELLAVTGALLAEAAQLAWQHSDVEPPGGRDGRA
jgi:hypothetical protein